MQSDVQPAAAQSSLQMRRRVDLHSISGLDVRGFFSSDTSIHDFLPIQPLRRTSDRCCNQAIQTSLLAPSRIRQHFTMPYRVEYASSSRAGCNGPLPCGSDVKIKKGEVRLGVLVETAQFQTFKW